MIIKSRHPISEPGTEDIGTEKPTMEAWNKENRDKENRDTENRNKENRHTVKQDTENRDTENRHTEDLSIEDIDRELSRLPEEFLVYKTIHGRRQPYLQWHEAGKTKSRYIKKNEREQLLLEIARRDELLLRRKRFLSYHSDLQDAWKKYPTLHTQNNLTRTVGIGFQYFAEMMEKHLFYVDKSMFIKAWWEDRSKINLITRPRRFGKSLNLDMLDCFFSDCYKARKDLFEDLQIWECREYRSLQGTYPLIHMDFSNIKTCREEAVRAQLTQIVLNEYYRHNLINMDDWKTDECWTLVKLKAELKRLCCLLSEGSKGKKVIILIDEYDTPIQEAWEKEAYRDIAELMREFFHCLLKGNPYLEKAMLTGITRVSRESLFSDLNNLTVSSIWDDQYAEFFGFTEEEVFASLDSQHSGEEENPQKRLSEHEQVKRWYDGFTIGKHHDIYNPWSVTNYLRTGILDTYWANTSSNHLISDLVRHSGVSLKEDMECLLRGDHITAVIHADTAFEDIYTDECQVWGLLASTGYLTGFCKNHESDIYELWITNHEVMMMFTKLFTRWFSGYSADEFLNFQKAMLSSNSIGMKDSLQEIALETFSYFDTGIGSDSKKAENFYHGFMLGLTASMRSNYVITSNRESGIGRYDVCLIPKYDPGKKEKNALQNDLQNYPYGINTLSASMNAVILEFKVCRRKSELKKRAEEALDQIKKQDYAASLRQQGFEDKQVLKYGIAFYGKNVEVRGDIPTQRFYA